jgi:anti-sigma28 factor (negative regulator of flagellin synthesis)
MSSERLRLQMPETPSLSANVAGQGTAAAPTRESEQMKNSSNDRAARIAELRRRYRDGSYRVDAAAVSKRIIDKHLPE